MNLELHGQMGDFPDELHHTGDCTGTFVDAVDNRLVVTAHAHCPTPELQSPEVQGQSDGKSLQLVDHLVGLQMAVLKPGGVCPRTPSPLAVKVQAKTQGGVSCRICVDLWQRGVIHRQPNREWHGAHEKRAVIREEGSKE